MRYSADVYLVLSSGGCSGGGTAAAGRRQQPSHHESQVFRKTSGKGARPATFQLWTATSTARVRADRHGTLQAPPPSITPPASRVLDHPHPMRLAHLKRHAAQRLGSLARALNDASKDCEVAFGFYRVWNLFRNSPGQAEPRPIRPVSARDEEPRYRLVIRHRRQGSPIGTCTPQ